MGAAATAAGFWCYWDILQVFARRWSTDPQYSHGPLIPILALGFVWLRREAITDWAFQPSWWGLPFLIIGCGLRIWAAVYYFEWIEWVSILPVVTGVCLLAAGPKLTKSLWPSIAVLAFMIPLPYRAEVWLLQPLQNLATGLALNLLQTIGYLAHAEGNVLWVNGTAVGVTEACSGLRMLTGFVALAFTLVLFVDRPRGMQIILLASSVPVALICNLVRITITAIVYASTGSETAQNICHDSFGWGMTLLGVGLLWCELQLLDTLCCTQARQDVGDRVWKVSDPISAN